MTISTHTLDDRILMLFEGNLRRIFAMKITRSTFRELQNVILTCVNQNKEMANALFESLLTGQIKGNYSEQHREALEALNRQFTIPARLAKEVYERGEFINIITSDVVTQQDEVALLNRLRRIDGDEFVFLSDPENTVHLLQHMISRLQELQGHAKGKEALANFKKELNLAGERLKQLAI